MAEFLLGHGVRVIDLIAQDEEGHLGQVLHREQRVQLGFALGKPLVVLGVHHEHDAAHLREVVLPQPTRLLVPAQVEGREAAVADGELFGGFEGGRVSWWLDGGRGEGGRGRTGMQSGLQDGHSIILNRNPRSAVVHKTPPSHDDPIAPLHPGLPLQRNIKDTYLQHMQQRRLARVVEAQEEEFGMLVDQAERRQHIPDCPSGYVSPVQPQPHTSLPHLIWSSLGKKIDIKHRGSQRAVQGQEPSNQARMLDDDDDTRRAC